MYSRLILSELAIKMTAVDEKIEFLDMDIDISEESDYNDSNSVEYLKLKEKNMKDKIKIIINYPGQLSTFLR